LGSPSQRDELSKTEINVISNLINNLKITKRSNLSKHGNNTNKIKGNQTLERIDYLPWRELEEGEEFWNSSWSKSEIILIPNKINKLLTIKDHFFNIYEIKHKQNQRGWFRKMLLTFWWSLGLLKGCSYPILCQDSILHKGKP
jgi:hypothetical protein